MSKIVSKSEFYSKIPENSFSTLLLNDGKGGKCLFIYYKDGSTTKTYGHITEYKEKTYTYKGDCVIKKLNSEVVTIKTEYCIL